MNEKQSDDILMKARSSRSCIGAGYRLFTNNFKRILRYSWLAALVYAAVCSAVGTMAIHSPRLAPAAIAVMLMAEALFASYGFAVLKQHQTSHAISTPLKWYNLDTAIFLRTLKSLLCQVAVYLPVGALVGGAVFVSLRYLSTYTAVGAVSVLLLAVAVLLIPMAYPVVRYVLTDNIGFWRQLATGYRTALRHWGFIFVVVLVASLIEMALSLLTAMPSTILTIANTQATISLMMGDANGMPSYITLLAAVTFLIIGFIQAYVQLSFLFPLYYMYGSIDAKETERQKNQNIISQ